jgi:hypothetical protein
MPQRSARAKRWIELLARVFGFNMQICLDCGGRWKIVAAILGIRIRTYSKEACLQALHSSVGTGPVKSSVLLSTPTIPQIIRGIVLGN